MGMIQDLRDAMESLDRRVEARMNNLQSPTKVLAHLPTFAISVRAIYQFVPFPPIQCCLSW